MIAKDNVRATFTSDTEVVRVRRTVDASPPRREAVVVAPVAPRPVVVVARVAEAEAAAQRGQQLAGAAEQRAQEMAVARRAAAGLREQQVEVAGLREQQVEVAGQRVRRAAVAVHASQPAVEGVASGLRQAADASQLWAGVALWPRAVARPARFSSSEPAFEAARSSRPQAAAHSAGWRLASASECSAFEYSAARRAGISVAHRARELLPDH